MPLSAGERNEALQPVDAAARVFRFHDHAALWFSLGVGLLVMQTGAYLVPAAGMRDALVAVLAGSAIGAGLLAWTARIGCATGLSSAGLMHRAFGRGFARLPVLLNIVQLVGWTTFELVVMRDGTLAIVRHASGLALPGFSGVLASTLAWGGVLVLLLAGSMVQLVRRVVSRIGLPLVVLSLAWLTWQFGSRLAAEDGLGAFWSRTGDGSMGLFAAMDLVIAMPVSWLPLVSDYARHGRLDGGRGPGKAFFGTWLGYAVANIWCYGLGVVVVGSAAPDADMLGALLLAQGGLLALGLILIDELDNAYGDVYSGSVSAHSIWPHGSVRRWGLGLAVACTLLALVLPMHGLEPFLLMLSSVFVPLYGVILGRLGTPGATDMRRTSHRIDIAAAMLWVGGIVLYHALAHWAPGWGSALPTLAATFAGGWLTRPMSAANEAHSGSVRS